MRRIYLWFIRPFKKFDIQFALDNNLKHRFNVYGDMINLLNCRSVWSDKNDNWYYVEQLHVQENSIW